MLSLCHLTFSTETYIRLPTECCSNFFFFFYCCDSANFSSIYTISLAVCVAGLCLSLEFQYIFRLLNVVWLSS